MVSGNGDAGTASVDDAATQTAAEASTGEDGQPTSTANPVATALADARWVQAPGRDDAHWAAAGPHWRHAALDAYLTDASADQPDWASYLADENRTVAANTAICLARSGGRPPVEELKSAVLARDLALPLRQAAAESLAFLETYDAEAALGELVDHYNGHCQDNSGGYLGEIHAAVLRSFARHVDAPTDARFAGALDSESVDVQLAVLAAYARAGRGPLPPEAVDLRYDPDARVRAAALEAMAGCGTTDAVEHLEAALADYDLSVRLTAIRGLGVLAREEARPTLERLLDNPGELVRVAAAEAITTFGDQELVIRTAGDEAWRVRTVAAAALGRLPYRDEISPQTIKVMEKLLVDQSVDVQLAAVTSLGAWPIERAAPRLLLALEKSGYRARRDAAEQLAARWPDAGEFPVNAPGDIREKALIALRQRWNEQHPQADTDAPVGEGQLTSASGAHKPVSSEEVARFETLIAQAVALSSDPARQQSVVAELAKFGDRLEPLATELVVNRRSPLPDFVYGSLLATNRPVFAALERLKSPDFEARRRAAAELVTLAADQSLGPLAMDRLARLAATEPDPLVWHRLWQLIDGDSSEPATLLAYAAIGHRSPEVRRRACEHLDQHSSVEHARVLLPALNDPNPAVVAAAVRALGHEGMLTDPAPLERLLAASDHQVRVDAAIGLVRNGSPAGVAALERLSLDHDAKVRVQAARAMSELGDPQFMPALVGMLDDDLLGVRHEALAALREVVGQDIGRRDERPAPALNEEIERWKSWWRENPALSQNQAQTAR